MILLGVIGWLWNKKEVDNANEIKSLKESNEKIKDEQNEIKTNYLNRFENVKGVINLNHIELMKAINRIEINCAACNKE